MWIILALISAIGLGFYDVMKKLSLKDNNVPLVLWFNTLFCTLLTCPVLIECIANGGPSIGVGR